MYMAYLSNFVIQFDNSLGIPSISSWQSEYLLYAISKQYWEFYQIKYRVVVKLNPKKYLDETKIGFKKGHEFNVTIYKAILFYF